MELKPMHYWLDDHSFAGYLLQLFGAIDNGGDGLQLIPQPLPFAQLDMDVREIFGDRRLTVVFIGHSVGITDDTKLADDAIEGCNHQYRLAVPTLQHAHTLWKEWLDLILECYRGHRGMSPRLIMPLAKVRLPRACEVKSMKTLVPVYKNMVIIYESSGESEGDDDDFVVVRSEDEVEGILDV
ncbi:hypothetical protein PENSPDRAFT_695768 [Peniophora sp. CONT]|nr:hypothetical protein PENSPDRAFT_695768 [Peniophora sp. CONT]